MDPTATPTLTPTAVWFTPTPYTDTDISQIDPLDTVLFQDIAETGVQVYGMANQTGFIDNLLWVLIIIIIIMGTRKILREIQNL